MQKPLTVAYFTMEIGLSGDIPTYAGGLGMLAADLMRSCADLKVPAACITVCWQHGYMRQSIAPDGKQKYEEGSWKPQEKMTLLPEKASVTIEGREVKIAAWKYSLTNEKHEVPMYFLD